jgi:peptidyl-prolyl cis-trans isomerase A (cyclophilin A)
MRLGSLLIECSLLILVSSLPCCGSDAGEETKESPAANANRGAAAQTSAPAAAAHPALRDPSLATEKAPEKFRVKLATTKGDIVVEVERAWAPHGADRLYNLVNIGYFTDIAMFRAVRDFVVQFGMHGDPEINRVWSESRIPPDPVAKSNERAWVTFAMAGSPDTRSTQLFINLSNKNVRLDSMGFAPVGRVVEGMTVVDGIFTGYGESPDQSMIASQGNAYLQRNFPKLDYILSARIVD